MLRIENLTKYYKGSNKGVTDLSLHVMPGDIYAFIGHNGAGKTTLLKCIAGIHDFEKAQYMLMEFCFLKILIAARSLLHISRTIRIYMNI